MSISSIPLLGVAEKSKLTGLLNVLFAVCVVSRQVSDRRREGVVAPLWCMLGEEKERKQVRKLPRCWRCRDTGNGRWFYSYNGSIVFACYCSFRMRFLREWHCSKCSFHRRSTIFSLLFFLWLILWSFIADRC